MSYITELIKLELNGEVKTNELTEALAAYKAALGAGLTVEEANKFAEAVYKESLGVELTSSKAISLVRGINVKNREVTYTVTVNGKSSSSNSLISLFRTIEGLSIPAAKRLVDAINAESPYLKGGLTRGQAEELANRIREAGGNVSYFESPK